MLLPITGSFRLFLILDMNRALMLELLRHLSIDLIKVIYGTREIEE